jgi:hypothetical protein
MTGEFGSYGDGTGSYGDGRGYTSYGTTTNAEVEAAAREAQEMREWEAERGPRRTQLATGSPHISA